ncbi:MAG TPA: sigma-70 family RNA polymerase sigma factor [Solirubrobacteraceae bacterium]|nr:sigma-70 family RNA polymerase sigma factor [Solirubrobacteraceae bacterium]
MDNAVTDDGPERELLAQSAAGDREAFKRLYRCYESRIYGYVRNIVGDAALTDDLVVETMTAVWHGAPRFGGASRVSTWILGIARHKAIDAVRARARLPPLVPVAAAGEVESMAPGPLEIVDGERLTALTAQALALLTSEHREALRLAFFEELSYDEIATLVGIPPNTVKSRVFYAKQALKRHLDSLARAECGAV